MKNMPKTPIDHKGYGKIYKSVMRNKNLPLLAKSIYAYISAYAGNGTAAFPKREKIVRDLKMNKDTSTKHLNTLLAEGLISKQRTTTGNIYTIIQDIPSYSKPNSSNEANTDMLVFENVKAHGFGTIPKLVMLDTRLSAQAKAIYAYFASFAGAGTTAFPRRSTIIRELATTEKTYYKHYNQLITYGYLSTEQSRSGSRYDVSIYRLAEEIEIEDTVKQADSAMSEKLPHGMDCGKSCGNSVECSPAMSEKLPSEKGMSEKIPQENFGHANIKNSLYNKQEYNKQNDKAQIKEPVCGKLALFVEEIKHLINWPQLKRDIPASLELRKLLGQSQGKEDYWKYFGVYHAVVDCLPGLLTELAQKYDTQMLSLLSYGSISDFCSVVMEHYREIRNVSAYVSKSLRNLR